MTRNEYMKILTHKLRRLPKDDYYRAVEYFEEYFDEAGPDQEQQAIEDLGSPEEAAKALIVDLAAANVKEPPKTIKKGLSAVWIAILAVFAAPIAVPLALCVILAAGALLLSLGAVVISVIAAAVGIARHFCSSPLQTECAASASDFSVRGSEYSLYMEQFFSSAGV